MTLVSVIIPVYCVEKYLRECLDSVISQTLTNIEIICVNDASTDNSLSILEEYAERDFRIKIITHEYNQGLGATRNTGVYFATSPYIAFVDSDDYIDPEMVEILYKEIVNNDAEMSWCGITSVSEEGLILYKEKIPTLKWTTPEILNAEVLYPSILSVCNKLFVKDLIKDIKQLPIISEDQPALAEYFTRCNKIVTTEKALYFYRKHTGTLSDASQKSVEIWDHFFKSHEIFFQILSGKYSQEKVLKKQAILRYFSLLWRIKTFNLLQSPSWQEQEERILFHLKEDRMKLKEVCPVLYHYITFILRFIQSFKIKNRLIKIGLKLARGVWLKRCNYFLLPIDILITFIPKLKLETKNVLDLMEVDFYKITSLIYKLFNSRDIWLIGERKDTAEENGYYFYKYIKTNHPGERAYYLIVKNCKHYERVKKLGNIINYASIKHKILFLACKYYVTSHNKFCFPITTFGKKNFKLSSKSKNVFLQHGITQADVSDDCGKNKSSISLFICGAKPEYDYVKQNFGYTDVEVGYTGFARFDSLHNFNVKKQILLMPTWRKIFYEYKRKHTVQESQDFFKSSDYYKIFQSFITNTELISLLSKYDYWLFLYPHYEIQNFISNFSSSSERIVFATKESYLVQDLLKDSALLITDTSSVQFDFAYMFKPVIYYFFDRDKFSKTHIKPGYFEQNIMGFGEVVEKENELIQLIKSYLKNDCKMIELYKKRVKEFFPIHDANNCERIYKVIKNY